MTKSTKGNCMPRIVRFHEIGGPEVLKLETIEVPAPGPNEVRILVKAIGLNRAEALFRAGKYLERPNHLPSRIGYEASGIIEAVGLNVQGFLPGDIVSVIPIPSMEKYGVYGEVATVPADYVVKHPQFLNFEEAASLWMQYLTAYGALIGIAKIKKNDFVIIPAASSSVGIAAIQLVLMQGAIPIATTRTSQKRKALEKIGAQYVIATQEESIVEQINDITKGKGARVVFDPVGGKTVLELAKIMAPEGIMIEYGALSSEHTPFPLITALQKGLTMRGYTLFELLKDPNTKNDAVKHLLEALELKKIHPILDKIFTLDKIVEAHRYLESNQQFGKIIVKV